MRATHEGDRKGNLAGLQHGPTKAVRNCQEEERRVVWPRLVFAGEGFPLKSGIPEHNSLKAVSHCDFSSLSISQRNLRLALTLQSLVMHPTRPNCISLFNPTLETRVQPCRVRLSIHTGHPRRVRHLY